ncbi:MAG: hypothetical protein ACRENP_12600 [Longimicrobiales bacterium]
MARKGWFFWALITELRWHGRDRLADSLVKGLLVRMQEPANLERLRARGPTDLEWRVRQTTLATFLKEAGQLDSARSIVSAALAEPAHRASMDLLILLLQIATLQNDQAEITRVRARLIEMRSPMLMQILAENAMMMANVTAQFLFYSSMLITAWVQSGTDSRA